MKVYNKRHGYVPPDAVYIGRGSPYGNPFLMGRDGDRNAVCDKYIQMVESQPGLKAKFIADLKGKDLVCWCAPKRCHGDYLLRISNKTIGEENGNDT